MLKKKKKKKEENWVTAGDNLRENTTINKTLLSLQDYIIQAAFQ